MSRIDFSHEDELLAGRLRALASPVDEVPDWSNVVTRSEAVSESRSEESSRGSQRRSRLLRLAAVMAVIALLAAASVAGAHRLDLFDGTPASQEVKTALAQESQGAPPALDPKINADATVEKLELTVPQGVVKLYVTSASAPGYSYCMGLAFTWLSPKAGMGCTGPGGPPVNFGLAGLGRLNQSRTIISGRVSTAGATTLRVAVSDGSSISLPLTDGFFLGALDPGLTAVHADVLDSSASVLATQALQTTFKGLPSG